MRALRGWRPPKNVMRIGLGVVMALALSVAVVAESTAASSVPNVTTLAAMGTPGMESRLGRTLTR